MILPGGLKINMNIKNLLDYIFGTNQKQRFKRLILTIILIVLAINLILNITCGASSDGKIYFQWKPAATIEVKK
jgi:hypothetical protein